MKKSKGSKLKFEKFLASDSRPNQFYDFFPSDSSSSSSDSSSEEEGREKEDNEVKAGSKRSKKEADRDRAWKESKENEHRSNVLIRIG